MTLLIRPVPAGVRIDLDPDTVAGIIAALAHAVATCDRAQDSWRTVLDFAKDDRMVALDSPEYVADIIPAMDVEPILLDHRQATNDALDMLNAVAASRADNAAVAKVTGINPDEEHGTLYQWSGADPSGEYLANIRDEITDLTLFVETKFNDGWQSLTVTDLDGTEVGGITKNTTGRRTYWAQIAS